MTIRLHLGAHKTATTQLQSSLGEVRAMLEAQGLGYLGPNRLRDEAFPLHDVLRGQGEAEGTLRGLLTAWRDRYPENLISDENIIGTTASRGVIGPKARLYPNAEARVARLLELLEVDEVDLFLAIRDPAEFITSCYGQQVRMGTARDVASYTRGTRIPHLSWAALVGRLVALPQVRSLTCWRYEDFAALRPRILAALVGEDLAAQVPDIGWANTGISQAAYEMFLSRALTDLDTPLDDLMQWALDAHPKTGESPPMRPFVSGVYERSAKAYASDWAALSQMDKVRLLAPEKGA